MKEYYKNCLYEYMTLKSISVNELSEATGISEITISKLRNCCSDCKISTVLKIADYLEISLDVLFNRENKNVLANLKDKIGSIDDPQHFYQYLLNYRK